MRKNKGKIVSILLILISVLSIGITTYAHSGRTDSSGGHPAHLHSNVHIHLQLVHQARARKQLLHLQVQKQKP